MPISPLAAALIVSLVSAAVTAVVLVGVAARAEWTAKRSGLFAAFAAGALLVLSLFHLAPEALSKSPRAFAFILAGLAAGFLLETVLGAAAGARRRMLALGVIPVIGIAVHSFIDGWVYSVTFQSSVETGFLTALGLMVHEFPEGIIVFVLLARAGIEARPAFWLSILAAAATTPLGVLSSMPFVASLSLAGLGDMLGVSAGLLFYVGAANLLPSLRREPAGRSLAAILAGGAMVLAITFAHG